MPMFWECWLISNKIVTSKFANNVIPSDEDAILAYIRYELCRKLIEMGVYSIMWNYKFEKANNCEQAIQFLKDSGWSFFK